MNDFSSCAVDAAPSPLSSSLPFYLFSFLFYFHVNEGKILIFVLSDSGLDFFFLQNSSLAKQILVSNQFYIFFRLAFAVLFQPSNNKPKDLAICIYHFDVNLICIFCLFDIIMAADSRIDGSFDLKAVCTTLLAAEKEAAKALLTLFLKKQGLSNAVAARTINKSDLFIDHLVSRLRSFHKSRYPIGSISKSYHFS